MEIKITIPNDQAPLSTAELLEKQWLVPRKVRHFLRMRNGVAVNGAPQSFNQLVKAGEQVTLTIADSDYAYQPVQPGDSNQVEVLFEDDYLIIVNKPVGIKTHPNEPDEKDTMQNHLAAYLAAVGQQPYVVHRLDRETSGAVMFAKNPLVVPILGRLLEEKRIYRRYQAIVSGELRQARTIDQKIGRDRHDRRKRRIDPRGGQTAITHVTVHQFTKKSSEIYCQLDTGRTHQIRVHLASIGHPIIGDPLYGKQAAQRMMLHAYEMHFQHPFSGEQLMAIAEPGLW